MTHYSPADETGDTTHDDVTDRVTRGVALLDYAVEPVTLDVRVHEVAS